MDDLHEVIEEGRQSREEAAKQAEEIIENQVEHFMGWLRSLDAVDTIREYREMTERLTKKITHQPSVQMNQAAYDGRDDILDNARELLGLKNNIE